MVYGDFDDIKLNFCNMKEEYDDRRCMYKRKKLK